jgi:hypothetical protein
MIKTKRQFIVIIFVLMIPSCYTTQTPWLGEIETYWISEPDDTKYFNSLRSSANYKYDSFVQYLDESDEVISKYDLDYTYYVEYEIGDDYIHYVTYNGNDELYRDVKVYYKNNVIDRAIVYKLGSKRIVYFNLENNPKTVEREIYNKSEQIILHYILNLENGDRIEEVFRSDKAKGFFRNSFDEWLKFEKRSRKLIKMKSQEK